MVVTLKGFLETEEGLDYFVLLVEDESFVVMGCWGEIALDLSAEL